MMQRRAQPAERTEAGRRPVGQTGQAGPVPPDNRQRINLRPQPGDDMVDQRLIAKLCRPLVAAEAARLAAGEDRGEDQAAFSTRTGTDFPAGTWLCSALCVTGIRMLHSG